ncbi:hypothetical protein Tco_1148090 [Tanacetum coccineum]
MIGQFLKEQSHSDLDSPINVMPKLNYHWIMSEGLKSRRKLSYPKKIYTTSVIDHYLGSMVLGKPFAEASRLVYDKGEGTVTFRKDNEGITFKMPHKMERFKHIDREIFKTDSIPPFIITDDDSDQKRTHYLDSLNLEPAYRRDENVTKVIQCLMKMENRTNEG